MKTSHIITLILTQAATLQKLGCIPNFKFLKECLVITWEYAYWHHWNTKHSTITRARGRKNEHKILPFSLPLYGILGRKKNHAFSLPYLSQLQILTPRLNINLLPVLLNSYINPCKLFCIVETSTQKCELQIIPEQNQLTIIFNATIQALQNHSVSRFTFIASTH